MGTPDVRVDEGALGWDPAEVTVPAVSIPPAGPDELSKKIHEAMPGVATEVVEQVNSTRAREERFAANLASARTAYQGTDGAEKQGIEAAARRMDEQAGASTSMGASGGSAVSGSEGLNQPGGQFGQLISMAMQTGQQAVQLPVQAAGMAGQLSQSVMQGVQGLLQQSGQTPTNEVDVAKPNRSTEMGVNEVSSLAEGQETDGPREDRDADRDDEKQEEKIGDEAAGGTGQRAPVESAPSQPGPETGRHHRLAHTSPEVAL